MNTWHNDVLGRLYMRLPSTQQTWDEGQRYGDTAAFACASFLDQIHLLPQCQTPSLPSKGLVQWPGIFPKRNLRTGHIVLAGKTASLLLYRSPADL